MLILVFFEAKFPVDPTRSFELGDRGSGSGLVSPEPEVEAGPGVRSLITPESSLSGNTAWSRKPDECGKQDRTKFIPDFV